MARVDISLNGRTYRIACDDGQEHRVLDLAEYVDGRLAEIRRSAISASDIQLLVMLSLTLADELFETQGKLEAQDRARPAPLSAPTDDAALAEAIGALADHVESIAARLRQA